MIHIMNNNMMLIIINTMIQYYSVINTLYELNNQNFRLNSMTSVWCLMLTGPAMWLCKS